MATAKASAAKILDTAIELAEESSWGAVSLQNIAEKLKINLLDIHKHYREKDEISSAWFDRADATMLSEAKKASFKTLSTHEQIHLLIMTWLNSMSSHRRVTRQMIYSKLEPGHFHANLRALKHSRQTVQWFREAVGRKTTYVESTLEEMALTDIFLKTLLRWMYDDSENSQKTDKYLMKLLHRAENLSLYATYWIYEPFKTLFNSFRNN